MCAWVTTYPRWSRTVPCTIRGSAHASAALKTKTMHPIWERVMCASFGQTILGPLRLKASDLTVNSPLLNLTADRQHDFAIIVRFASLFSRAEDQDFSALFSVCHQGHTARTKVRFFPQWHKASFFIKTPSSTASQSCAEARCRFRKRVRQN